MNIKFLAVIVLIIGAIIGIGIVSNSSEESEGGPSSFDTATVTQNFSLGDPNSKVTLVEAYDFGCGVCKQFNEQIINDPVTGTNIYEEYKDRIYITAKNFPLPVNGNSFAAHRAGVAAASQNKFWEMNEILFSRSDEWLESTTTNPIPVFEGFAEELGLDIAKFKTDFASSATNDLINRDKKEMTELGANATPTFYLNGQQISNSDVNTPDKLRQVLDAAIAAANGTDTNQTQTEPANEPAAEVTQ